MLLIFSFFFSLSISNFGFFLIFESEKEDMKLHELGAAEDLGVGGR